MADDAGTRLRNVSDYGDIFAPDLGFVVPARHEVVVADTELAERLISTGAFIAVGKPGPKPADQPPPASDPQTPPTTPADAAADTTPGEEHDQ